ncbi:MAG: LPS export ABC transporter periplasmic protein LptC [Bacteriovoracaceae bacterium]|nr:LPS export ABC transporter periplasmic protein LptC [Bacteriovoracaceae bacterium]
MRNKFNILMFFTLSAVLGTYILSRSFKNEAGPTSEEIKKRLVESKTEFVEIKYYLFKKHPVLKLNADTMDMTGEKKFSFDMPHGAIYDETGVTPIFFSAESGNYSQQNRLIALENNVQLSRLGAEFEAKSLKYSAYRDSFWAWGNIRSLILDVKSGDKLEITANEVQGWPSKEESSYKGNVVGKLLKKRKYETGLDFKADVLKVNMLDSLVTMQGSVRLEKQRFNVQAGRAELLLENFNKKLKYYVLYDDIRLEEKLTLSDGSTLVRKAFSENLEGYNNEGKIVLTGAPRVIQGNDVIKGYKITLRENVEVVEVDEANSIFTIQKN